MKLSTLIIIVLLGAIAYALWNPPARPVAKSEDVTPAPTPKKSEAETLPIAEVKKRLRKMYEDKPRYMFYASVVQHLSDGPLLIHGYTPMHNGRMAGNGDFAVLDIPGAEKIADGTQLNFFLGCFIGTYEYTTVNGSNRTIPEVLYSDHECFSELPKFDKYGHPINRDPDATPAPPGAGDNWHNPLDLKPGRRRSL